MSQTGIYILKDRDQRPKLLPDQPWPITEAIVKRLQEQGYAFQTAEEDKRRAFFQKIE
jgi:hypothetical protein